jgi:hypothetical protein
MAAATDAATDAVTDAVMIAVRAERSKGAEGRRPRGGADESPLAPSCGADGLVCDAEEGGCKGSGGPRPAVERIVCADDPMIPKWYRQVETAAREEQQS